MPGMLSRTAGHKRLDLGGGGDSKMQYLMIGGLSVVILGSIIFIISSFTGGGGTDPKENFKPMFKCIACQKEFELNPDAQMEMMMAAGGPGNLGVDCPHCNAQGSAFPMTRCPECETVYLSPSYSDPNFDMLRGDQPELVCPKCNTDYYEYYRKKREERRR